MSIAAHNPDRVRRCTVRSGATLREAVVALDHGGIGVVLVTEGERRLVGLITDGDVRRAILRGVSLESPAMGIANRAPVTVSSGIQAQVALDVMNRAKPFLLNQLPVIDGDGNLCGLFLRSDVAEVDALPLSAVVMAGGFGTRLMPLTEAMPKPMLPIGDKPLLEHIIGQLRDAGVHHVNVTTHYMPEVIERHFGDGSAFGVKLQYVPEERPLGTAGALGLLQQPQEPLLVMNGDILTRVDYRAMLKFHREHAADMTVGVRHYELKVPYGVLECDGPCVRAVREKPSLPFLVNAGIYLLEPSTHAYISQGVRTDMPELIERLIADGRTVISFPVVEYWLDIGRHDDYARAQTDIQNGGWSK